MSTTNQIIMTTMAYLFKDGKVLMLHRTKKNHDVNHGKWIGVGGKVEYGESPLECIKREVFEETGLTMHHVKAEGYVTFPGFFDGVDAGMFVYSSDDFSGTLKQCNEGELKWIPVDALSRLPMWEGDYHFLDWMKDDQFHIAKMAYDGETLIEDIDETY